MRNTLGAVSQEVSVVVTGEGKQPQSGYTRAVSRAWPYLFSISIYGLSWLLLFGKWVTVLAQIAALILFVYALRTASPNPRVLGFLALFAMTASVMSGVLLAALDFEWLNPLYALIPVGDEIWLPLLFFGLAPLTALTVLSCAVVAAMPASPTRT
jgi:hypothetical protein